MRMGSAAHERIAEPLSRGTETRIRTRRGQAERAARLLGGEALEITHHQDLTIGSFERGDRGVHFTDELPTLERLLGIWTWGRYPVGIRKALSERAPLAEEGVQHAEACS